jgi:hypothetical protein
VNVTPSSAEDHDTHPVRRSEEGFRLLALQYGRVSATFAVILSGGTAIAIPASRNDPTMAGVWRHPGMAITLACAAAIACVIALVAAVQLFRRRLDPYIALPVSIVICLGAMAAALWVLRVAT